MLKIEKRLDIRAGRRCSFYVMPAIKMKVSSVSHDPPMHMGGYVGPRLRVPNLPIFLSLFPSEERWLGGIDGSEKLVERPVEKVRIKTETEGERDAQIIRPMVGPSMMGMNPPVPTTIMLTESEFNNLGRPTLGDEVTLTIERVARADRT